MASGCILQHRLHCASCGRRRTLSLTLWSLKERKLGLYLRAIDTCIAKQFQEKFTFAPYRGKGIIRSMHWSLCLQCNFWACQHIIYRAQGSEWEHREGIGLPLDLSLIVGISWLVVTALQFLPPDYIATSFYVHIKSPSAVSLGSSR